MITVAIIYLFKAVVIGCHGNWVW